MSDIVERLRELEGQTDAFAKNQHHSFVTIQQMARESAAACRDAAATIERLTKENAELKASGRQAIDAGEEIIERLTKELEDAIQRGVVLAIKYESRVARSYPVSCRTPGGSPGASTPRSCRYTC